MPESTFFRLLKMPIDEKGDALAALIADLNASASPLPAGEGTGPALSGAEGERSQTFTLHPADFALIPGSPFAYWVSGSIRRLFNTLPSLTDSGVSAQHGASTKNDYRFLRLWWEVPPSAVGDKQRWALFAKGGQYSPHYSDVHLLVNWENDAREIHAYLIDRYPYLQGNTGWVLHPENSYFRPGLTWPRRTQKGFNVRAMPAGCIFADKGPAAFVASDDDSDLLALLAVMNSLAFQMLVKLQMAFGSYEVGVVQRTPVPPLHGAARDRLAALAREAHDLQRDRDRTDETTHAFGLPSLLLHRAPDDAEDSLELCALRAAAAQESAEARLAQIQAEIDDIVFDLYGMDEADRALVRAEMGVSDRTSHRDTENTEEQDKNPEELRDLCTSVADSDEEEAAPPEDIVRRVQDLLMWCVGVSFGRWDVRMALDASRLPALGGPFDPLPRCAPGALTGPDGLPVTEETICHRRAEDTENPEEKDANLRAFRDSVASAYPIHIPWDGILVDDPTHPSDIVARVRQVLALVWGERADDVEREACRILGIQNLRDWFRDPRRFFAFHIKRYSKSRRKAPIYWPLQSDKRNYTVWLYCHRMRYDILYAAGRSYADRKVTLEQNRLEDLQAGVEALSGSARRNRERDVERQKKIVDEIVQFGKRLDAAALLDLPPDLNDGVIISIAPLRELVPWKEAERMWDSLMKGEYPWSTMSQRMRQKGLVKDKRSAP